MLTLRRWIGLWKSWSARSRGISLSSSGGTRISLPDWMVGLWRWARRLGVRGRRVEHTDPQKGGGMAAAQDFDGQFWLQGSDSGRQAGVLRVGPDLTPSVQ